MWGSAAERSTELYLIFHLCSFAHWQTFKYKISNFKRYKYSSLDMLIKGLQTLWKGKYGNKENWLTDVFALIEWFIFF